MSKSNHSQQALRDCILAIKSPQWHVRLIHANKDMPVIERTYTPNELFRAAGFLRLKNCEGYNIYGRPVSMRHILVDDLDEYMIDDLIDDGLQPALVIETSPGNHQAWITVSRDEISYIESTSTAKLLAEVYGGDKGAAKGSQLGRLPSFTNRKSIYQMSNGLFPFARIVKKPCPRVAKNADDLLKEARSTDYFISFSSPEGRACVDDDFLKYDSTISEEEAIDIYNATYAEIDGIHIIDRPNDRSLVDFSICKRLYKKYGFYPEDVEEVILHGSDKGGERGENYAYMTAKRAYEHSPI